MQKDIGFPRSSGVILHLTSLPGRFGIGDMGPEARHFVEFMVSAEQSLWQMLPLGPTGYGNSPYQCLSAFAGNHLLLSPERLREDNLLADSDLEGYPSLPGDRVDYEAVSAAKMALLRRSHDVFAKMASGSIRQEFDGFCERKASWLNDYALFMALREAHNMAGWADWEDDVKARRPEAMERWGRDLAGEVAFHKYLQFQFFRQWEELRSFCRERGIRLIGDIPIFVAEDSADVWANPGKFCLDDHGAPTVVAGVPPDYFSSTGQRWGNPLYRWDVMKENGYSWWVDRLRTTYELVDILRIDHFRGFEKYWEIPAPAPTAAEGRWVDGPGFGFFEVVQRALGRLPIIAEDLGLITAEVEALRDQCGFPGMKVLQFAFGGDPPEEKEMPHRYAENCVAYTGTHDNNTTVGWFNTAGGGDTTRTSGEMVKERGYALQYLGTDGQEINWDFIHAVAASPAHTAIFPLQDILGLGAEARLNLPGGEEGNWEWRADLGTLTEKVIARLRVMTVMHGRSRPRQAV